jgi:glycerol-3-phosphate dehydrogenase (NAD(P)+)
MVETCQKIVVIGAGAWGTTISVLLAERGHNVTLWAFEKELVETIRETRENKDFLPGFQLPSSIEITNDLECAREAEIVFVVVPTQFLSGLATQLKDKINPNSIVVSASKGLDPKTLKLPQHVLADELKTKNIVVLSGPNLSAEISKGLPAATVAASKDLQLAKIVQEALNQDRFRVYTNPDPLGVQLGGALKNIIAITAGIVDGLDLGINARSALIIRGETEITRLGTAMGADPKTFSGLSGMGDLIATCSSTKSRNHRVGEQLAAGKSIKEILGKMKAVAEGVETTKAAIELGKKYKADLPIITEAYKIMYEGKNAYQAITDLMTRTPTSE